MRWTGRVLGDCSIESEIGRGELTAVYRAFHSRRDRWVAVKIIPAENETFIGRFRREAKKITSLRHPHILSVYEQGEVKEGAYIVMEYVPEGTWADRLTGQPLPWPQSVSTIVAVGRALAHAHSQKIWHGDVQPANIFMPEDDWPLLSDFQLFRLVKGKDGMMIGGSAYVAPEQVAGEPVDHRADIYSLGVILYQMLTGRLPFIESSSLRIVMLQRLFDSPPKPTLFNNRIDPKLETFVLRALSRKAGDRQSDMAAFLDELTDLAGVDMTPTSDQRPETGRPQGTRQLETPAPPPAGPHLLISGTSTVLPLPFGKEVVLGRADSGADVQPNIDLGPHGGIEAGVSRLHARLRPTARGWLLTDLKSTNGTTVNGKQVNPGELIVVQDNDVIHCGRLMLVFHEE